MKASIMDAFKRTKSYYCLECGKCTSICPVTTHFQNFSPRLLVKKALLDFEDDLLKDENIWQCTTCNLCNEVCPSDVLMPEFIRSIRVEARNVGNKGVAAHCDVPNALSRLMANDNIKQNRLKWLDSNLKVKEEGDYLLFTGCSPYFKILFSEFDDASAISRAAVSIMNELGIEPVLLPNEKCSGHDMLWTGQNEVFDSLKRQNTEAIKNAKAKKVITTCAECYYTLKNDYELDAEVLHISQFLAEYLDGDYIELKLPEKRKLTFHDPCRLGRFGKEYDAPRKVLEAIKGAELVEMEKSRHKATCCGINAWMNCDDCSKDMRMSKLLMAKDTGAEILATACPKCRIHLRCYTSNEHVQPQVDIDIEDLTLLTAEAMGLLSRGRNNG
jgi:Fe-S oxidoreductase